MRNAYLFQEMHLNQQNNKTKDQVLLMIEEPSSVPKITVYFMVALMRVLLADYYEGNCSKSDEISRSVLEPIWFVTVVRLTTHSPEFTVHTPIRPILLTASSNEIHSSTRKMTSEVR